MHAQNSIRPATQLIVPKHLRVEIPRSKAPFLAVVPMVFSNAHERAFWQEGDRPGLLASLLREVSQAAAVAEVAAVVEEGLNLGPFPGNKIHMITVPAQDRPRTQDHPFDNPVLQLVLDEPRFAGFEHVVHVDFRHVLLQEPTLTAALELYRKSSPPVLVSVNPTRGDHPCQYLRHFRIMEKGILHFLEAPGFSFEALPHGLPRRITRPFPFDWARYTPEDAGDQRFFRMDHAAGTCLPLSVDEAAMEPVLWFRQGSHLARVLIRLDLPDGGISEDRILGVFHSSLSRAGAPRLAYATPNGLAIAFGPAAGHEQATVLLAPFGNSRASAAHLRLHPQGQEGLVELELKQAQAHGLVFTLLAPVSTGPYDMALPYEPMDSPWRLDRDGIMMDVATGKRMLGRQDFLPVQAREDALAVFPKNRLAEIPGLIASGQARGFLVEQEPVKIRSGGDAALAASRLSVMLAAKRNGWPGQSIEYACTDLHFVPSLQYLDEAAQ